MTYPSSRRADAVQGSQQAATGLEPSSGVGPAFHPDESAPYPRPLRSYLELGALPTAVPCARLHARHLLWEWEMNELASTTELLVSELVTNAVKATVGHADQAAVRLRLSGDSTRLLIEVWDADPRPPAPKDLGEDGTPDPQEEGGRGLFLVATLSQRWGWLPTQEPAGKVIWCEIQALLPRRIQREQVDMACSCLLGPGCDEGESRCVRTVGSGTSGSGDEAVAVIPQLRGLVAIDR